MQVTKLFRGTSQRNWKLKEKIWKNNQKSKRRMQLKRQSHKMVQKLIGSSYQWKSDWMDCQK